MKITKIIAVLMIVLMAFVAAGCDKDNNQQSNKNTNTVVENKTEKPTDEIIKVKVYFPNSDATKLVAVEKKIKTTGSNKYKAAMDALMEGTNDNKLTVVIPKQAKLLGVSVSGDTAKVDFDKALVKNFNGGSTGEEFLVGSIVNTLTEFPEIKKVQITIEGRNVESIKGHMDTSKPLTRMDELLK